MFLVKNSKPIRPGLLIKAESLLSDAVPAVLRFSHSESEDKKCFKYRPSKKKDEECRPVKKLVPPYYRQLKPCRTDRQLAVQHPRDLGLYGRCDIPYNPQLECMDPCELETRLDDTMYKPSASLDRKFDKYWVECSFRKQKQCCRKVPPERSVRVPNSCQKPPAKPCDTLYPMPCKGAIPPSPCPRFTSCGCAPVANAQVNCRLAPRRKRCRRRPCLYPSFSECQHDELEVGRPIECKCLQVPAMCDVYRYEALGRRNPCDKHNLSHDDCKDA